MEPLFRAIPSFPSPSFRLFLSRIDPQRFWTSICVELVLQFFFINAIIFWCVLTFVGNWKFCLDSRAVSINNGLSFSSMRQCQTRSATSHAASRLHAKWTKAASPPNLQFMLFDDRFNERCFAHLKPLFFSKFYVYFNRFLSFHFFKHLKLITKIFS